MINVNNDVTEHKQEEEEPLRRETLLSFMLNTGPGCIKRVASDGTLLYVNPTGLRMFELAEDEAIGRSVFDAVVPEHRASYIDMHQAVIKGASRTLQYEIQGGQGTRRWMETYAVPFRNPGTGCTEHLAVTHDITERKRMEATLRENEEGFRSLVANVPGAIYRCAADEHWTMAFLSDAVEQLTGYPAADFLNNRVRSYASVIHPDDRRLVEDRVQAGLAEKEPYQVEYRVLHRDGTTRWVYEKGQGIFTSDGSLRFLDGAIFDVTERKRMEALLRSSEEKLRQILNASNTGLWDWNTETNKVGLSREWKRQLGYEEAELPDTFDTWAHRLHPDDHARAIAYVQAYLARPEGDYQQEFRLRHKDGTYRWIEARASFVTDPDGRRVCLLGSHIDITDRKQAEEVLRQSETRFRSLFENSPIAYQSLDQEGRFIDVNQRLCRLLGYEREELIGREFGGLWADEIQSDFPKTFVSFMQTGKVRNELALRRRDGTIVNAVIDGRIQRDKDGKFVRTHCILTDITERKQAEEALRRSEARLNEAQRLAHLGSWELNLTTNRLTWSDEIYRIFELDQNQFGASYEAFLDLVHPEDRAAVDQAYTQSVRLKTPYEITHRLRMPDGRVKYVQEWCETLYDAQGAPQRSFGTVQDVTDATRLAQREAARLTQLQNLSELGLTLSGDPVEIFERVVRMLGELFQVRVVCLSEIVGEDLHFRAVYCNGQVVRDAGRCPLAVTPCATVQLDKEVRLFDCVMERFPEATFLRDHQAMSYCGFPALDAQGQVVAVTCLLDDKPRAYTDEEQALLRVFGQRIAIEIERARYLGEQRRQAKALQRSHAFLRQVIDTAPNFIFAKDRVGRFVLANQAVAEAYGTTVEHLLGKTDADFNPNRSEVEFFRRKDLEVMESAQEQVMPEEVITDAAGRTHWLQTVKRPILDEEGQATMVLGVSTDITERKMAEDALRLTQYAVDHADDFIFVIGPDGSFKDVNESACRRLGYSRQELLAMSVMDIDQDFQLPRWETFWQEFRHTKRIHFETKHRSKSGEIYPVEVTANYILHDGRELDYAIVRDITDRKRLEAELTKHAEDLERLVEQRTARIAKLEAQRAHAERLAALGQVAAGVAHEINNPIAGIKNAFRLVKEAIPNAHPYYEFVGMIDREIDRTVSIVRQMYELYRPEPRKTEDVDLGLLIGDLVRLFEKKLSQQNLLLTTDLPSSLPRVRVSRGDLLQVLVNLVQNAIDCSIAHGSITLSLCERDGCLRIAVADKGPGIASDVLPKIFDPFFTTKTEGGAKGMGLGLSVSHNLVQAMGGKIEVETQENRGSTFTVVLPLVRESSEPSSTPSELWEGLAHDR